MSSLLQLQAAGPLVAQVRGLATLKDISIRLKSVKNIQKITKSMKLISATKFNKAEKELRAARAYGMGTKEFFDKAEIPKPEQPKGHLLLGVTSDRGLCGAANSSISKAIKAYLENEGKGKEVKVIAIGDKARAQLKRLYGDFILMHFKDIGKKPPTFADASYIAQEIANSGYQFDTADIFYNSFKSVVSYKTTVQPIYSQALVSQASKLSLYDSVDPDTLTAYNEFALASLIFFSLKEGAASEQSARMTAMDAASKNAGEMINKLTLTYNRTRQAVITRELIEIISGAAAV